MRPVYETYKLLWNFYIQTDNLISTRRPELIIINKKENLQNSEPCCPSGPQGKIERKQKKKKKKKDMFLDPARKFKKLCNMKVTIIPIVIGALGTVTKGLIKGLEDLEIKRRVEIIKSTALMRTARIPKRVLKT